MESRFTPLLAINYVPSKDELLEIHNLLIDPVDQLSQLDAEIAHLQSVVDKLTLKRNQLHAHIVSHRKLLAPLRRIPEELLQEIFCHCIPVDHNAVMSCHEAPLLLGRVCSQWRSVSQSTPRLWSSVHIVITSISTWPDEDPSGEISDTHEAVKVWLSRSGVLPLSISLFQAPYTNTSPEYVDQLMSTLMRFSSRWKNMSLIISPSTSPQLSSLSHKAVPLLETLSLHGITNTPSPLPESAPLNILRAPRLRIVSFCHLGMAPEDMAWSRLTSLSLESHGQGTAALTPTKAFSILRECPRLIHCSLDFTNGWGDFTPLDDQEIVTMPLLETLSVYEGAQPLKPLFEHLRLPVLVNLLFGASPPRRRSDSTVSAEEPPICTLLSRLDSLRKLTLSTMNLTPISLMSCLQHAPSIIQLSILNPQPGDSWPFFRNTWGPITDEVAVLLTPAKDRPTVCPLLKILECNPCHVSDAALLAMIQQRTVHATIHDLQPLERVDMILHREREIDILSMLPPNILTETTITLQYVPPAVVPRRITPKAGLEKLGRLYIPNNSYEYMYH